MLPSLGTSRAVAAASWQKALVVAARSAGGAAPSVAPSPQTQRRRQHLPFQIHRFSSSLSEDGDDIGREIDPPAKVVTRATLAEQIAEEHDMTAAKSRRIVDSVLDGIVESLSGAGGEETVVRLSSFGIFDRRLQASRKVRNPRTGEVLTSVAKQRVRFRASKGFKDAVNDI
uniref:Integration host factor subunit alpha n=1 Tax=Odontella aurita TaxID=265563 RepID=A0A7S4HX48_9STRA|mmetsp:Transcript_16584/g.47747  ORF Transcript_16584/g.47747 Transcript_16584/m.47747 type:complete len:172 (+) Transcript_16584:115-630(+)